MPITHSPQLDSSKAVELPLRVTQLEQKANIAMIRAENAQAQIDRRWYQTELEQHKIRS